MARRQTGCSAAPSNLFATITEGLEAYARACAELFREGMAHERFAIRRMEASPHRAGSRPARGPRRGA